MAQIKLTKKQVREHWLTAQGLHERQIFGKGPQATVNAISHLGYVQIDTIHVIERSHHHILYTRIPDYKREHLHQAQSKDKTIFEYWTHALAYIPTADFKYFMPAMKHRKENPSQWYANVSQADLKKVLNRIKKEGPISIRDITDDELVEKDHDWASKKPSKRAMQMLFNQGELTIAERQGMLKKYELTERHFGWKKKPKAATAKEVYDYELNRALKSQAVITLESGTHLMKMPHKKEILKRIELRIKKKELVQISIEGIEKPHFWTRPEVLEEKPEINQELVHILSPFDPLVIQRKRFHMFFDYDHRFEAYLPKEKRKYGYFALPVIIGDRAVAVIDLKTDRQNKKMLVQQWSWLAKHKSASNKKLIERSEEHTSELQSH